MRIVSTFILYYTRLTMSRRETKKKWFKKKKRKRKHTKEILCPVILNHMENVRDRIFIHYINSTLFFLIDKQEMS